MARAKKEMAIIWRIFLITLVFMIATPNFAIAQKTPIVIDFVVDPAIQQRPDYDYKSFYYLVEDIVMRASLIFNLEIYRPLKVGTVQIGTPIKDRNQVADPKDLFAWLKTRNGGSGQFIVFLSEAPFFDLKHDRLLGGESEGQLILLEYVFETQRVAFVLLHEIGHLCGVKHSIEITSIMSTKTNRGMSYEEAIPQIRRKCG